MIEKDSLDKGDRCDRCGAAAKLRVQFNAGPLDFCGHHGRKWEEAKRGGLVVIDERANDMETAGV